MQRLLLVLMALLPMTACAMLRSQPVEVVPRSVVPVPVPWTAEDQERLYQARVQLRLCRDPQMSAEMCEILLRATTEYGALRERNRQAAALSTY